MAGELVSCLRTATFGIFFLLKKNALKRLDSFIQHISTACIIPTSTALGIGSVSVSRGKGGPCPHAMEALVINGEKLILGIIKWTTALSNFFSVQLRCRTLIKSFNTIYDDFWKGLIQLCTAE